MILSSLKLFGRIIRQPRVARISLIVERIVRKMIAKSNWSSLPKQIFSLESKWLIISSTLGVLRLWKDLQACFLEENLRKIWLNSPKKHNPRQHKKILLSNLPFSHSYCFCNEFQKMQISYVWLAKADQQHFLFCINQRQEKLVREDYIFHIPVSRDSIT